eukprot:Hpha_TRINITY_DN15398_c1_g5::TRINITY_DN15398_c1_g5_i1::g.88593::m.88593/K01069/E3.1.2.6, gloB; hydroxyacylglutathione hydrolase
MVVSKTFGARMKVVTLGPAGPEHNYTYLVCDTVDKVAVVVDPAQSVDEVPALVESEKVVLKEILTTHHHWDHAFGNEKITKKYPGTEVVGGDEDEVEACTHRVKHRETWSVGGLKITALNTKGHTDGHICYLIETEDAPSAAVFTGDCLFVGGCGRCLEGSYAEMWHSLSDLLGSLPGDTSVYPAHEYTIKNYEFGVKEDPENKEIAARLEWAKKTRAAGGVTVPTTIAEEARSNIFLRPNDAAFRKKFGDATASELFSQIRKRKDGTMEITTAMLASLPGMIPGKIRKAAAKAKRELEPDASHEDSQIALASAIADAGSRKRKAESQ